MRRLKTVLRPPIYPKTPGHLPCSSLTHPLPLSSRRPSVSFGGFGLRACGVRYDVRKADSYSVYDRFDFDIPVGTNGDSWDRYFVRVQEMYESLRIVEQALELMPDGPVSSLGRRLIRPAKGDVYVRAENPRGEIGVYLVSDGTDKPYRVKVRPPSFCNLSALKHMLKETWIADAVVILGSLDIVLGEVDR